eukprot:3888070-Alexandrium_andersonii.AAC.1
MSARATELGPSLLSSAPGKEKEGRYSDAPALLCTEHAPSSSRGCKRGAASMSESCMEFDHSCLHDFKSRNLGSIHPTSWPGERPRGLQEVFVHAAQ